MIHKILEKNGNFQNHIVNNIVLMSHSGTFNKDFGKIFKIFKIKLFLF